MVEGGWYLTTSLKVVQLRASIKIKHNSVNTSCMYVPRASVKSVSTACSVSNFAKHGLGKTREIEKTDPFQHLKVTQ